MFHGVKLIDVASRLVKRKVIIALPVFATELSASPSVSKSATVTPCGALDAGYSPRSE
jgi:hypothetical protein